MAIILDTNTIAVIFDKNNKQHTEFKAVIEWILKGNGTIVYGGKTYLKELSKTPKYLKIIQELRNVKKVCVIPRDKVDNEEKRIKNLLGISSSKISNIKKVKNNDTHLIAISGMSNCKLLCSLDKTSYQMISRKNLYADKKPLKIYKGLKSVPLLCDKNIHKSYKPFVKLSKKQLKLFHSLLD